MTTDEAREAAWLEWYRVAKHQPFLENVETGFTAGWDARGQHDKEQIAALVEAVIWMSGASDFAPGKPAHAHWIEIRDGVLASALAALEEAESV